jgi:hypothetical protein
VSEELKACPLCGGHSEIRNVGYEDQRPQCVMSKCRIGAVETFYSPEQAMRYWNKLPRLDEKRKAKIALELFNEFDKSVPPAKSFKKDWDKFMSWLDEKAKGWE